MDWLSFDIVLGILLGSTLSRALTASSLPSDPDRRRRSRAAPHHARCARGARWHPLGFLVKGRAVKPIENGRLLEANLRRVGITPGDLHEQLRSVLNTDDLGRVREAFLERGGNVSFIPR